MLVANFHASLHEDTQALELTYAWKEGGAIRQHTEQLPAGANERRFQVKTGATITDEFVRFAAGPDNSK